MLKKTIRSLVRRLGYEIRTIPPPRVPWGIPDEALYRPLFSPWYGDERFERYYGRAAPRTLVSRDRCYVLYSLARQALHVDGEFVECGVYQGGTAALLAGLLEDSQSEKRLYLFDTFDGMPETDPRRDLHKQGAFSDTSLESVQDFVGGEQRCIFRKGLIPETFLGLENTRVAFAHLDVDIYRSILDSLAFLWPRLSPGGFVVLDDYGFPSCPGARQALDEFFAGKTSIPLCLTTGQAVVFKGQTRGA